MYKETSLEFGFIGDGQMSKAIQFMATQKGHRIASIVRKDMPLENISGTLVYEVALPGGFMDRMQRLCAMKKDIVIVTTGWYNRLDELHNLVLSSGNRVLWSSNFSLGVQLFFKIVEQAAKWMNAFEDYDIWATELHHRYKQDAPSGTAKTLGEILLKHLDRKTALITEALHRKINDNEIHFSSTRGGTNNFAHTICFDGPSDSIRLSHSAQNRDGYASGALLAGEWLHRQVPGFYGMEDYMRDAFDITGFEETE